MGKKPIGRIFSFLFFSWPLAIAEGQCLESLQDAGIPWPGADFNTGVLIIESSASSYRDAILDGAEQWNDCNSREPADFPFLVEPGDQDASSVNIRFRVVAGLGPPSEGSEDMSTACGIYFTQSRVVELYTQQRDKFGDIWNCPLNNRDVTADIIAHELGHFYGLNNIPRSCGLVPIMGPANIIQTAQGTPPAWNAISRVTADECNFADGLSSPPNENSGGGGGGGCGVCIPPDVCVLGFCVTGCLVKWQCDVPAETCINGQCQPASPVVARVGSQDFLSVVSVWETAFSDAASGVCIYWNGKDQNCTMTGWPVDPYVGHLVWLTEEEYALLNLGAELVVDVALNLIGSASPQPPGVSPTYANGFASLERALGAGDRGYADFSGCPSDFAANRKLYFWLDHDTVGKRNGLMQASELKPADYTGLFGFHPETLVESKQVDAHGNWLRFWVEADCADCGGVMVDYFPVLESGDLPPSGSIPPARNTCSTAPTDVPLEFSRLLAGDR